MSDTIEKVIIMLTGIGMLALVINYPQVPLALVNAVTTILKGTVKLAGG